MELRRGDIVVVAAPGDYGKPRPALILQSDLFKATESVVVALITNDQRPQAPLFRRPIQPSATNGLRHPSDVMLDNLVTLSRAKVSDSVGHLADPEMAGISASLVLFLGMAG
jgi:mRNA interferase MazF